MISLILFAVKFRQQTSSVPITNFHHAGSFPTKTHAQSSAFCKSFTNALKEKQEFRARLLALYYNEIGS